MGKRLLNHYRLKRKLETKIRRARQELLAPIAPHKSRHDYAWRRKKRNPYAYEHKQSPLKQRIQIVIILLSFVTTLGFIFFHKSFHITTVSVSGLTRLSEYEISDAVLGSLDYKKVFLFPAASFFLTNVHDIKDTLHARFPVESVLVKKSFPNTIEIFVNEKISTIIYDNGQQYAYIGLDGKVVEPLRIVGDDEWMRKTEIVTSTNELGEEVADEKIIEESHKPPVAQILSEMGDYPIVYVDDRKDLKVNDNVIKPQHMEGIVEWFNYLERKTDIPIGYIQIKNEVGEGLITTREGWKIFVTFDKTVSLQVERLQIILKEKVTRPNFQYIDVRYEGRAFWR